MPVRSWTPSVRGLKRAVRNSKEVSERSGGAWGPWRIARHEDRDPRSFLWIVLGLTVLATVLRGIGLNQGLWYDEMVTLLEFVRTPFSETLTRFHENNHPLYSLLERASVAMAGEEAWALRLPAVLFGVASVPTLYLLGRAVTNRLEALLASALLAVSYHHVWFSQNARGYSALAFWTMVCTLFLLRALAGSRAGIERPRRWLWSVAYAAAAALGAYTHLSMVLVVASQALLTAWFVARRGDATFRVRGGVGAPQRVDWAPAALAFGLATGLSLLLYAPLLAELQRFFSSDPHTAPETASHGWALAEALRGLRIGLGTWVMAGAAALVFAAGLWSYMRQSWFLFGLFVLPAVLTGLATLLAQHPTRPRFLFHLIGFGLLVIVRGAMVAGSWMAQRLWGSDGAAGADHLLISPGPASPSDAPAPVTRRPLLGAAIVVVLIAASAFSLLRGYRTPKQDFAGALRYVEANREQGDTVATAGFIADYAYRRYYGKPWKAIESLAHFQGLRSSGRRAWLLYTLPVYIEATTPELMAAIRQECPPARVFPGTLGGGDLIVCAIEPSAATNGAAPMGTG
jgi:mannosyltransferase